MDTAIVVSCPAKKFFFLGSFSSESKIMSSDKFASDTELPVLQNFDGGTERFHQSIRRFEENRGPVARGGAAQLALAPPAFYRQKAGEEKFLSREARPDDCRQNRGRAGKDGKGEITSDAFTN